MGSSIVKSVLSILVLVILSFIVGIMSAENIRSAAMLIGGIAGIVGIVAMGTRVWTTIFLLLPVCMLMPRIMNIPISYILLSVILVYWLMLRLLGYVRFTWRKLWGADLLVLAFLSYMVMTFVRHPVSVNIVNELFDIHTEYVGGTDYLCCVFFLVSYLVYSCIPFDNKLLLRLFKWNVWIRCICMFILGCLALRGVSMDNEKSRFSMFVELGVILFVYLYCRYPVSRLITSASSLFGLCISTVMVVISGFRTHLAVFGITVLTCVVVKREFMALLLATVLGASGLFCLQSTGALSVLPYSVQRSLSLLVVSDTGSEVAREGRASNDWRKTMWKWALDPRSGYIKDYIFGDGCGLHYDTWCRDNRGVMRGTILHGDHQAFARSRQWHSGFISTLQSLGWVGLSLTVLLYLYGFFAMFRIASALRGSPYFPYCMVFTCGVLADAVQFYMSAGTLSSFILGLSFCSYLKLFHSIAVEEGYLTPGRKKSKYVPLLIRSESAQTV